MKRIVALEFSELDAKVPIELDDSQSPNTVTAIISSLPISLTVNRWGDELYSDELPVKAVEENGKTIVNLLDVAYWPEGSALCLFYGPTPISKDAQIKPYSAVNVIGKILTMPANLEEFLSSIESSHVKKKVPVVLR